jgi:hypothetical protein
MCITSWLAGIRSKFVRQSSPRRKAFRPGVSGTESLEPRVVLTGLQANDDAYNLLGLAFIPGANGAIIGYKLPIYANDTFPDTTLPYRTLIGGNHFQGSVRPLNGNDVDASLIGTSQEYVIYTPPGPISGFEIDAFQYVLSNNLAENMQVSIGTVTISLPPWVGPGGPTNPNVEPPLPPAFPPLPPSPPPPPVVEPPLPPAYPPVFPPVPPPPIANPNPVNPPAMPWVPPPPPGVQDGSLPNTAPELYLPRLSEQGGPMGQQFFLTGSIEDTTPSALPYVLQVDFNADGQAEFDLSNSLIAGAFLAELAAYPGLTSVRVRAKEAVAGSTSFVYSGWEEASLVPNREFNTNPDLQLQAAQPIPGMGTFAVTGALFDATAEGRTFAVEVDWTGDQQADSTTIVAPGPLFVSIAPPPSATSARLRVLEFQDGLRIGETRRQTLSLPALPAVSPPPLPAGNPDPFTGGWTPDPTGGTGMPPAGMPPTGMPPADAYPPAVVPPAVIPPAVVPPGIMPPEAFPPGVMPPGYVPPGYVPPGYVPLAVPPTSPPSTTPPGGPVTPPPGSGDPSAYPPADPTAYPPAYPPANPPANPGSGPGSAVPGTGGDGPIAPPNPDPNFDPGTGTNSTGPNPDNPGDPNNPNDPDQPPTPEETLGDALDQAESDYVRDLSTAQDDLDDALGQLDDDLDDALDGSVGDYSDAMATASTDYDTAVGNANTDWTTGLSLADLAFDLATVGLFPSPPTGSTGSNSSGNGTSGDGSNGGDTNGSGTAGGPLAGAPVAPPGAGATPGTGGGTSGTTGAAGSGLDLQAAWTALSPAAQSSFLTLIVNAYNQLQADQDAANSTAAATAREDAESTTLASALVTYVGAQIKSQLKQLIGSLTAQVTYTTKSLGALESYFDTAATATKTLREAQEAAAKGWLGTVHSAAKVYAEAIETAYDGYHATEALSQAEQTRDVAQAYADYQRLAAGANPDLAGLRHAYDVAEADAYLAHTQRITNAGESYAKARITALATYHKARINADLARDKTLQLRGAAYQMTMTQADADLSKALRNASRQYDKDLKKVADDAAADARSTNKAWNQALSGAALRLAQGSITDNANRQAAQATAMGTFLASIQSAFTSTFGIAGAGTGSGGTTGPDESGTGTDGSGSNNTGTTGTGTNPFTAMATMAQAAAGWLSSVLGLAQKRDEALADAAEAKALAEQSALDGLLEGVVDGVLGWVDRFE